MTHFFIFACIHHHSVFEVNQMRLNCRLFHLRGFTKEFRNYSHFMQSVSFFSGAQKNFTDEQLNVRVFRSLFTKREMKLS